MTHELDKYKERGEEAGRRAARWWAEVSKDLDGECASLVTRIADSEEERDRLGNEVTQLASAHRTSADSHDEARLRERERQLDFARRERRDLRDRLDRARARRAAAYQMARTSAEQFRDYYEGLMRSYCAANRKAPTLDHLPSIQLPSSLEKPQFEDPSGGSVRPSPSAPTAPLDAADAESSPGSSHSAPPI
jgi:chromosome segregation ATPase